MEYLTHTYMIVGEFYQLLINKTYESWISLKNFINLQQEKFLSFKITHPMSINRRPLHFFSLMLLLLVAFALRQQSSSDEADSAVASVAPSSELAPEVHSVTVATDSLLLVRMDMSRCRWGRAVPFFAVWAISPPMMLPTACRVG